MTGGKLRYPCRHRDRPSASRGSAGARCQRMIQISVPMHAHFVVGSIENFERRRGRRSPPDSWNRVSGTRVGHLALSNI
jgi:hypothetical protein